MTERTRLVGFGIVALCLSVAPLRAHNGLAVGHSPPAVPEDGVTCPSDDPLKLFVLPDPILGGPIDPGMKYPHQQGLPTVLTHVAISAPLGRPEFGGYVYSGGIPGFHFVDALNACHALTLSFTNGTPFVIRLDRTYWPNAEHEGIVDEFGAPLLINDGTTLVYGNQNGAHFHPVWLLRRPGVYAREFRVSSDYFAASDEFSLQFASPSCWGSVPVDLSGVFNADVVDSGAGESLTAFDGAGHYWLLDAVYGTDTGLPQDGLLDVFQLGGPDGLGLQGSNHNCLLDNGSLSTASMIDLAAQGLGGAYESAEILVGASGSFTSSNQLVLRLTYESGSPQVVALKRAASAPRFFPLLDWQINGPTVPELAVGRNGVDGKGFVRSNGTSLDESVTPADSFYFQRVTFPVDPLRNLLSIGVDDYSGTGRVGVFALTLTQSVVHDSDADGSGFVDLVDWVAIGECFEGPDIENHRIECAIVDHDCDGDVDLEDWAVFQNDFGS